MEKQTVIARAHLGEPLKRVAVMVGDGLIYLSNPGSLKMVQEGERWPIGFPREDVFHFDLSIFYELEMEWRREKKTSPEVWQKLQRYRPSASVASGNLNESLRY